MKYCLSVYNFVCKYLCMNSTNKFFSNYLPNLFKNKFIQSGTDEPMQRSRSNHNMGGKKSPKKSKKSKSHSKLYELDKEVVKINQFVVMIFCMLNLKRKLLSGKT